MDDDSTDNLFDKLGVSVQYGEVEVGQIYPIYGVITQFVSEEPGNVVILVNKNIEMNLSVIESEKISILKERAFDPGIFVCTVKEIGDVIKCDCSTIVFGKKQVQYEQ